jgi:hypothetical protein
MSTITTTKAQNKKGRFMFADIPYISKHTQILLFCVKDMIWYNCTWVDNRSQQYSTHLHTNSTQNTENGTYIKIKKFKNYLGSAGRAPSLRVVCWHLLLQLRK